ncbi:MAG: hypothetical protein ACYC6C_06000 [Coriobacteriia bacterium]
MSSGDIHASAASGGLDPVEAARLRERPDLVVRVAGQATDQALLARVSLALRRCGLRVRTGTRIAEGLGLTWSRWAGPVSYVAFSLFVALLLLGLAAGYEGTLLLPSGITVSDEESAHESVVAGPLFDDGFSGADLRAEDSLLQADTWTDGSGAGPLVTLRIKDGRSASFELPTGAQVRLGSVLVRGAGQSASAAFSIETSSGVSTEEVLLLLEYARGSDASLTAPALINLSGRSPSLEVRVRLTTALDSSGAPADALPVAPEAIVETRVAGDGAFGQPVRIPLGGTVALPGETWLRLFSAGDVVRVVVSTDPAAPYRYALLVVTLLAAAVRFVKPSRVLVGVVRNDATGPALHVIVSASWRAQQLLDCVGRELEAAATEQTVVRVDDAAAQAEVPASTGEPPGPRVWILPAVVFAVLLGLLAASVSTGSRGRVYLEAPRAHTATSAADAYRFLEESGVRGRVLVLLDDRSRIVKGTWQAGLMDSLGDDGVEPPVMGHNITSSLIYAGIAREVYFIPPSASWDVEFARLAGRDDDIAEDTGLRVRFYGAAVHLTEADRLPEFDERVVVLLNGDIENEYDPAFLERITDPTVADVVVRQVER